MSYTAAVMGLAAAAFSDRDADVYSANQGITLVTDGIRIFCTKRSMEPILFFVRSIWQVVSRPK
jgi:hypothetical protein